MLTTFFALYLRFAILFGPKPTKMGQVFAMMNRWRQTLLFVTWVIIHSPTRIHFAGIGG